MRRKLLMFVILMVSLVFFNGCSKDNENKPNDTHTHIYSESYYFDTNSHWLECECGQKKELNAHSWDGGTVIKQATEELMGEIKYTCTKCGKTKNVTVDKIPHKHTFNSWVVGNEPTCYGDGTRGYRYCTSCQKYFDENFNDITGNLFIPALTHNFEYVKGNNGLCNEGGTVSHQACTHCGEKYGFETNSISLGAIGQWTKYPYGNWSNQEIEIIVDDANTCLKIAPCEWYPSTIGFKKDVTSNLTKAGTYRLLVDVKAGPSQYVQSGKLDLIGVYNGGSVKICEGKSNLTNVSSAEWTTLEYEFTIPTGVNSTYFNLDGYYWPEVTLSENYILIDNIRFVLADDETNTNIDGMGFGDFEGLINLKKIDSIINHNYDKGVVTKEATETEQGEKTYTCLNCGDSYIKKFNFGQGGKISILNLGNSFGDDSFWLLYDILSSLGYEEIKIGLLYIGGSSYSQHLQNLINDTPAYEYRTNTNGSWITTMNTTISSVVENNEWDFILGNQQSEAFTKGNSVGIEELVNYFKEKQPNAKIIWNLTWGHSSTSQFGLDYHAMYLKLMETGRPILEAIDNINDIIVTGTAIENARALLNDNLMRDNLHLNLYAGRYTAALTIAKGITGKDISNATYPSTLTEEQFRLIVKAVNAAFENKYEFTDLTEK